MPILNAIVHEVRKETSENAKISERDVENIVDDHTENLSLQLSQLFRKTGLNTGEFPELKDEDDKSPLFTQLLDKYFKSNKFSDFTKFSKSASKILKGEMDKAQGTPKGGFLWFNHYTHKSDHFLTVALLRKKSGLSISSDLSLDEIESLDLDKLHMAARINLSLWQKKKTHKYISFRIGKDAKDVTDYFAKFIGCIEYTQTKVDTKNLIQVTKQYCIQHAFNDEKTEDIKQFVLERCTYCLEESRPISIENLSTAIDNSFSPPEDGAFLEIAQDDPYNLNNEVSIDRNALKSLTRYSGRNKDISISFKSSLLHKKVIYNKTSITFKVIPENLKRQLDLIT